MDIKECKEKVLDTATGEMLVMELYSQLDDEDTRKTIVVEMLNSLYGNKKISNTTYREALDILNG